MGAGEEDLRAALLAADVVDIGADAVAVAEGLARDQLVAAHDALAAAEVDDDVAVLDPLDLAVDDLADAVLELLVLAVALGLAHLLDDHLLGRLGGDAAEIHRRQRLGDEVAGLGRRVPAARILDQDVGRGVLDLVDHLEEALQLDLAGLGVDLGADVGLLPVARARRLLDRVLHGGDHDHPVDRLLARDRVGDLQEFKSVCTDGHYSCSRRSVGRGAFRAGVVGFVGRGRRLLPAERFLHQVVGQDELRLERSR